MSYNEILELIEKELKLANKKYPNFHSTHEGYAVIKEEIDELWDEIKLSKYTQANRMMINEAIQVAAMSIKFIKCLSQNNY